LPLRSPLVFEPFVAGQIAYGKVGHFAIKANWQLMFQGPYNFWMKWESIGFLKRELQKEKNLALKWPWNWGLRIKH